MNLGKYVSTSIHTCSLMPHFVLLCFAQSNTLNATEITLPSKAIVVIHNSLSVHRHTDL